MRENLIHIDTIFIRALGIILVVNSHLDDFYPVSSFATGGAIGNAIFFSLSAYGLCLSQKKKNLSFQEWLINRFKRIYPTLWIVLAFVYTPILVITGDLKIDAPANLIGSFLNPPYWFIRLLIIYYIIGYPLINCLSNYRCQAVFIFLGLIYTSFYTTLVNLSIWSVEKAPFAFLHYFMVFIFGIIIAQKEESISRANFKDYIFLLLTLSIFFIHKYLMLKGHYFEYQFLQHVTIYPIVYFLLKISRSTIVINFLTKSRILFMPTRFLAKNTLEIYMIHEVMIRALLICKINWPYNVIILLITTLIIVLVVNKMREYIFFAGLIPKLYR